MTTLATPTPAADSPAHRLRALTGAAVIGTDRSAGAGGATTPAELLTLAAACGTRARAGLRPTKVDATTLACPPDPLSPANDRAISVLAGIMTDPDAGLIDEWASLAIAKRVRIADGLAPLVLDWWSRQPRRSEAVWTALGVRGAWLASLNPSWKKAVAAAGVPENVEQVWETATVAERAAVLTAIRRVDPARGLALARSTWTTDGADARQRFLECLREGCSMADEQFLESCLDDRSKLVRRAAAGVLGQIAGSRYQQRADARALGMIQVEKGGLLKGKTKIVLTPPAEFDKSWERDGIEEKAPTGIGQRAWWLRQILEAANPSIWLSATGLDPAQILAALAKDDFGKDATTAIDAAARRTAHPEWCAELLTRAASQRRPASEELRPLAAALPIEAVEAAMLNAAERPNVGWPDRWLILASTERHWSPEYSAQALTLLAAHQPKPTEAYWLYEGAERISRVVAPGSADRFEQIILAQCEHKPTDSVKKSLIRVRLRAEMHKELA